jgi:hypothetical protein
MSSQPVTTKEVLTADVTPAQIQQLIAERKSAGATDCQVEKNGNQRTLVCQWPRLK